MIALVKFEPVTLNVLPATVASFSTVPNSNEDGSTETVGCCEPLSEITNVITTLDVVPVALPTAVVKKPLPTVVPDVGCSEGP